MTESTKSPNAMAHVARSSRRWRRRFLALTALALSVFTLPSVTRPVRAISLQHQQHRRDGPIPDEVDEGQDAKADAKEDAAAQIARMEALKKEAEGYFQNAGALEPQSDAKLKSVLESEGAAEKTLGEGRTLLKEIEGSGYATGKGGAREQLGKLEGDAKGYYDAKVAAQNAKASGPPVNKKAQAAAKAAQPYFEGELRTLGMVLAYNLKATELVTVAKATVAYCKAIADKANVLQSNGDAVMAQRFMIQAHGEIGGAQLKEDLAKKIYKLAMALNDSVPAYQAAAQQAAAHVLATFAGIQLDSNGQPDADAAEQREKELQKKEAAAQSFAEMLDLGKQSAGVLGDDLKELDDAKAALTQQISAVEGKLKTDGAVAK